MTPTDHSPLRCRQQWGQRGTDLSPEHPRDTVISPRMFWAQRQDLPCPSRVLCGLWASSHLLHAHQVSLQGELEPLFLPPASASPLPAEVHCVRAMGGSSCLLSLLQASTPRRHQGLHLAVNKSVCSVNRCTEPCSFFHIINFYDFLLSRRGSGWGKEASFLR